MYKASPALEGYQPLLGTEHIVCCQMLVADGTDIPKVENSLTNQQKYYGNNR